MSPSKPRIVVMIPTKDLGSCGQPEDLAYYMGRSTYEQTVDKYGTTCAERFFSMDNYILLSDGVIT